MARERSGVSLFSRRRNRALFDPAHLILTIAHAYKHAQEACHAGTFPLIARTLRPKLHCNPRLLGRRIFGCRIFDSARHKTQSILFGLTRILTKQRRKDCRENHVRMRVLWLTRKVHIRSSCLTPGLICAKVNTDPRRPPGRRERMDAKRSY